MVEIDAPLLAAERGQELINMLEKVEGIESVRGSGLLLAAELDAKILDKRTAPEVARECLDAGLVVNGVTPTSLRLAPPLTITTEELNRGAALLEEVLNSSKGEE